MTRSYFSAENSPETPPPSTGWEGTAPAPTPAYAWLEQVSARRNDDPGRVTGTASARDSAELATVSRSGFVESRHLGSAVVLDPEGRPLLSLGAPDVPVFTRSSLKPLQAIAAMSLGAEVTGPSAALATASHRCEARHADVVLGMLESAGLGIADLGCPSVHPADGAFRTLLQDRARRAGEAAATSPLYFNCSGKHAAFLMAAVAQGLGTAGYLAPDHPVQQKVAEVVETFAGEAPAAVGIDGCGAPVFALSLTGLARAIGRVVRLGSEDPGTEAVGTEDADSSAEAPERDCRAYAEQARVLMDGVFGDPWAIEGQGRPNSTVIEELGVFAKGGAEGVMVMSTREGYSVAVKILDGASRAASFVALCLLDRAGAFDSAYRTSNMGDETLEDLFQRIVDPITGGTLPDGRTAIAGHIGLGEDVARIRPREEGQMAIRRRIDPQEGRSALEMWVAHSGVDAAPADRPTVATAVRFTLEELAARAEGNSVEVRVPPFGVTQCVPGPRHTRGTPPNVVETSAEVWLSLVTGRTTFAEALASGGIDASGIRADLSDHLPLYSQDDLTGAR